MTHDGGGTAVTTMRDADGGRECGRCRRLFRLRCRARQEPCGCCRWCALVDTDAHTDEHRAVRLLDVRGEGT